MSGHSKWAQIKHKKATTDAKRSGVFAKLARAITLAAKDGGNPGTNTRLRLAMDRARGFNVPNDNIQRAITRGTSGKEGAELASVLYEGYGPGNAALLIEGITDNKNRTAAEVRHELGDRGGKWAEPGSVSWMFERRGVLLLGYEANPKLKDPDAELLLIDAGATDIERDEDGVSVYTLPEKRLSLIEGLKSQFVIADSYDGYFPKMRAEQIDEGEREKLERLVGALEEMEDVENVWTNVRNA